VLEDEAEEEEEEDEDVAVDVPLWLGGNRSPSGLPISNRVVSCPSAETQQELCWC